MYENCPEIQVILLTAHSEFEYARTAIRYNVCEYVLKVSIIEDNEGKLAIYVNGVWGAPMISEDIHARYALLPTESGSSMSCESACLGYVLGRSGNEEREQAAIRFLKYIMSEPVQTRILEETEQIPANLRVSFQDFTEKKTRLFQATDLVLDAEKKIDVPDNLWNAEQKAWFTGNILNVLSGEMSVQDFGEEI